MGSLDRKPASRNMQSARISLTLPDQQENVEPAIFNSLNHHCLWRKLFEDEHR